MAHSVYIFRIKIGKRIFAENLNGKFYKNGNQINTLWKGVPDNLKAEIERSISRK